MFIRLKAYKMPYLKERRDGRALYKNAEIIVFDEPTSALDNETENRILNTLYSLSSKYTIFIISHNRKAIEGCDILIKLNDGNLEIQ